MAEACNKLKKRDKTMYDPGSFVPVVQFSSPRGV